MEFIKTSLTVAGREISIESGKLAKQANGACVVRVGDTMVLVTAVASSTPKEGTDFMPLTVDYKEPTDNETINFRTFAGNENRFKQLLRKNPEGAKILFDKAQQNVKLKYALYKQIADIKL